MYQKFLQEALEKKKDIILSALIQARGQILLLERGHGRDHECLYELPSTILKGEEDLSSALKRAVTEETNLEISRILSYLGHFDFMVENKSFRQFVFIVETLEPFSVTLRKHLAYAWLSSQEAVGYPISDNLRQIIDQYSKTSLFPEGRV